MNNFQYAANQVLDSCSSTNDIAKKLAENGCPHGTWVSSRVQESGRGRLGRVWSSDEGNLFLSIIVRLQERALWSWVPLTAAVAVTRCLFQLFPEIEVQIKWPNDLWVQGAKLGGVLCEGANTFIIIGLGLNCVVSPSGLDRPSQNLTAARQGRLTTADFIRLPILTLILNEIETLVKGGPRQLKAFYEARAVFPQGSEIEWEAGQSSIQYGIVQGLGPVGELNVIKNDGTLVSLFAEDVRVRKNSHSESIR